jgi:N-acetylneuraminic acid mutarotase
MKKLLLPLFVLIVCLASDTTSHTIAAATTSPVTPSWFDNITTRALVQTGSDATRAPTQSRTLSFAERVAYQRAIEEVYWRHRIWPKERPDPKPSLDAVMTREQLEQKVADYLRNSQALEDCWQQPITADQLQAEMDRMAQHTKQPEVLRELFEALGNDPFVIAECLARPALAERLLRTWYASDQRIHGKLKQRAEADLQAHNSVEQMKQLNGKYSEIELLKTNSASAEANCGTEHAVKLNTREWDQNVHELAATFNKSSTAELAEFGVRRSRAGGTTFQNTDTSAHSENAAAEDYENIPAGKLSSLQEDENGYYATAVIEKGKNRLRLARVAWEKKPLGSWVADAQNQVPTTMAASTANYALPIISTAVGGCIDDTWTATAGPPDGRSGHTAVWTGSEMIIWGGEYGYYPNLSFRNTGARYNPSINTWTSTSTNNAPAGRAAHTAVWTGNEMIVWGGADGLYSVTNTGGRYNPSTDSWIATTTTNAPAGRVAHAAVWTGSEMIVWGGTGANYLNTGGRYNPNTDSWAATNTTNAPARRYGPTAVWTGSEMIIWGGTNDATVFNSGGRYNPDTNSWTATSTSNAPSGRYGHTAVWTGTEMIVWGGYDVDNNKYLNTGGKYNPVTNGWTATSTTNAPLGRGFHTAVWTGSQMIVWGGFDQVTISNAGGRYNPGTNSWTATTTNNAPSSRDGHSAVWTGSEMIVWGGADDSGNSNTGGRYNPSTNSWRPTTTYNVPKDRASHTAVWTGSEMIIWGGYQGNSYLITGGRYNPTTDTWTATSNTNAPSGRAAHTAVWTGSEMLIWGGYFYGNGYQYLNTGGKYNPVTNSWTATSTTNAPTGRSAHTAIWSASKMIVWGGSAGFDHFNTGGLYNPATNTWAVVGTAGAPIARDGHTAVWTGSEMIVWGGFNFDSQSYLNTGGRYNPGTNSWTATDTTNAPDGRSNHTAVWTGSEMIVWGGDPTLNAGGRYDPAADSWTATNTTNAPDGRSYHTAVWTGHEMIVWGGAYFDHTKFTFIPFNTGGRYNPDADNWTATNLTNVPDARYTHTAVWTGNQMIVWGGFGGGTLDTGGRYCAEPLGGSQLGNISTRAFVQTGDNVLIGGFIVQGNQPKRVIIRAIGPELGAPPYNIPNALLNPTLELHDGTGRVIATNDNWAHTIIGGIITTDQFRDIINSGYVPGDERESAIIADLPAGNYTAIVRGVDNMTGVALVEVDDLTLHSASILGNISSRSFIQTGDNVMIGGFIVQGMEPKRVIIRAIGPELSAPPFNIPNALANPTLELHNGSGALIASNDNWTHTIIGGIITTNQVRDIMNSGYAPGDGRESAIIADLPAGNYTAIVRGVNNMTGVALVEVYDLN